MSYSATDKAYQEGYEKLRNAYRDRLKVTADELDHFLSVLGKNTPSGKDYERMSFVVHGLAGTGATFGFPQVSSLARTLDGLLKAGEGKPEILMGMVKDLHAACVNASSNFIESCIEIAPPDTSHEFHVLIVDDDKELSEFLTLQFNKRNIHASMAPDGKAALDLLSSFTPDLIILDIMMPGMSGHEVLNVLKNDPKYRATPILMLTSRQDQGDISRAFDKGVTDYIVKPFKPEHLIVKVEEILYASRQTILVIENDALVLELIKQTYQDKGFNVIVSSKGLEAWNIILQSPPDLIVLDWMLPDMDAMTIMKNLKQNETTKNSPVIILAAKENDGEEYLSSESRISKPFIPRDLVKRSLALLGKH
jgi:DNA-binding response OmpR family regulator